MVDHWNSQLYDYRHSFVSKFGKGIVELLAPQEGEVILDVGCGTGVVEQGIWLTCYQNMVHT